VYKTSKNKESLVILGHNAELHDRICKTQGDFESKLENLKTTLSQPITIGITRHNFFLLGEIIDFINKFYYQETMFRKVKITLFPVQELKTNFLAYLKYLKQKSGDKFEFKIMDSKLIELFETLGNNSTGDKYQDRELIRLLGIISEHTFIGPEQIVIDPFHKCNTNCVHCWNHAPTLDLTKEWKDQILKPDFLKRLIDDAARLKVDLLVFGGAGEPLMYPKIIEIFEYASQQGLKIIVSTNGINLTKTMTNRLLNCNLSELICSLPAASNATYEKVNPMHKSKKTFETVVKNLKYFTKQKTLLSKKSKLSMYHVIHNLNYHEIKNMAKLDLDIGVDIVRFNLIRLQKEFMHLKLNKAQLNSIKNSIDFVKAYYTNKPIILQNNIHFQIKNFKPETGEWSGSILNDWGCKLGWFFSLVLASGQLSLCCHVREIENLKNNNSFKEAWLSKQYSDYRFKAKYIKNHKNTEFKNKVKLYDDKCENCDNHVTLIKIEEKIKKYNLGEFFEYNGS